MTLEGAIGRVEPGPGEQEVLAALLEELRQRPRDLVVPVTHDYPAHCLDGRPWDVPSLPTGGWGHPPRRSTGRPTTPDAAGTASAPAGIAATNGSTGATTLPAPHNPGTPCVAGGTLSTWIVDLLLTGLFRPEPPEAPRRGADTDEMALISPGRLGEELQTWTPAWLSLTCAALRDAGLPVSAHTDDHAEGADCGCGAADSLGTILALLGQRPRGVDVLLRQWGVDPADLPAPVVGRCAALALTLPPGDGIVGVVSGYAQAPLPVMHGQHHEAAVLANAIPGTTVDVPRVSHLLARALPGNASPQSFVVDTWSFERIADFYLDRDRPAAATRAEVVATVAAFNAATVLTLCGPGMSAVTLRD